MSDEQTILKYLNDLKSSIHEECKSRARLSPFIDEIQAALDKKNYPEALLLIDELEEFMDLEFYS